jgi:ubiquinone/menaquinone biosynthesis C-methylase UbiE
MIASHYTKSVRAHYGRVGLDAGVWEGLRAARKKPNTYSYGDFPLGDQFYSSGKEVTLELAELADIRSAVRVLDVGGGLGGPARTLAATFGCKVTVLDVTEDYCRVGERLTHLTGLSGRVIFKIGNALEIPFPAESFDVVWTQQSSMNIADKERLYAEIHRVLKPGGRLALQEIMAGPVQPLHFPVPWAHDPTLSFLRPARAMRGVIAARGFHQLAWIDVSQPSRERLCQRLSLATVNTLLLVADTWSTALRNEVRNLEENRIVVIEAVFNRT